MAFSEKIKWWALVTGRLVGVGYWNVGRAFDNQVPESRQANIGICVLGAGPSIQCLYFWCGIVCGEVREEGVEKTAQDLWRLVRAWAMSVDRPLYVNYV